MKLEPPPPGPAPAGAAPSPARQTIAAMLIIAVALLIFYRDVAFGGRTFLMLNATAGTMPLSDGGGAYGYAGPSLEAPPVKDPGAIAWVLEPNQRAAAGILRAGELPLWNRAPGLGAPLFTDGNSAVFEPLQLLITAVPDRYWPLAVDLQVFARLLLAGLCTYLLMRALQIGLAGALFAGISFPLSSYFVQYGNHPQFKTEALLPVVLYCYHWLGLRFRLRAFLLSIAATAWLLLASFPQPAFLIVAITAAWSLYWALWAARDRGWRAAAAQLARLMSAGLLGAGVSAFFWLPLGANIFRALSTHAPGVGLAGFPPAAFLSSIVPDAYPGLWWAPHLYSAVLACAVLSAGVSAGQRRAVLFFAAYGAVFTLKLYAFPAVQWIGMLPGFSQLNLTKYTVPSISLCLVALAAFGVDAILRRSVAARWALAVVLAFGVLIGGPLLLAGPESYDAARLFQNLPAVLALGVAVCAGLLGMRFWRWSSAPPAALLVALALAEPLYWHHAIVRPQRYDPFTQPPFVAFLQQQPEMSRLLGLGGVLYPEIGTAYGLDDLRYNTALNSSRRFLYLTEFVAPGKYTQALLLAPGEAARTTMLDEPSYAPNLAPPPNPVGILEEGITRFVGVEQPIYLGTFSNLLNIAHLVGTPGFVPRTAFDLSQLTYDTAQFEQPPQVQRDSLTIAGDQRNTLYMHPPAQVTLPLLVPSDGALLVFGMGLDPQAWDLPGDGVEFQVRIDDGAGERVIYHRTIDPQRRPTDRAWVDDAVDLRAWAGRRIQLTLATSGGAAGDTRNDWASWSMPALRLNAPAHATAAERAAEVDSVDLLLPLLDHNTARQGRTFYSGELTIAQQRRLSLFMLAPQRAELPFVVPDAPTRLQFEVGVDPDAWPRSDGVRFVVSVLAGGAETRIYERTLDPERRPEERAWLPADIDLSAWRGQPIVLRFQAEPGPQGKDQWGYARWASLRVSGAGVGRQNPAYARFELIYDDEVLIYRDRFALPRAFVVQAIHTAAGPDAALQHMLAPGFDPGLEAVVEAPQALRPPEGRRAMPFVDRAEVLGRTANTMLVRAELSAPGLLVVSEAYDPDWSVSVDGVPAPLLPTNILLRGVLLPAGTHEVTFTYMPRPLVAGAVIAALAGLALLLLVLLRKRTLDRWFL